MSKIRFNKQPTETPLRKEPLQGYRVEDVRCYDPKAVSVAHHLGSDKPGDYKLISDWIRSSGNQDFSVDTLVELFDREVGLPGETSAHPDRMKP